MTFQFFIDYLKHRLTAKSRHGTHSPFVYKLTDEVIYDFSSKKVYDVIEEQRKKLLYDDRIITVNDPSTEPLLNKNHTKKISQITKNALKSPRIAQLIYRLANNQKPKRIIELGTCMGITTAYLAKIQSETNVLTIEGCAETAAIAHQVFNNLELKNIDLQEGKFDDLFPNILADTVNLDFVYIDGNHTQTAITNYFNWCLPKVNENSMLVFADIYCNDGMKAAWKEIKNHHQVTVTIDLFWIGLVFFRKGQAKEHFKLKLSA